MRSWQLMPILLSLVLGSISDNEFGADEQPHYFVKGSVKLNLPPNWVANEDELTPGKLVVMSSAELKDAHAPTDSAMGSFKIKILAEPLTPVELLARQLYDEGGPPRGAEIEPLEINNRPAARMSALDELFDQIYLWYAAVIQFDDSVIATISFTGLGDYKTNSIIDSVVKTLTIDSQAFKTALTVD